MRPEARRRIARFAAMLLVAGDLVTVAPAQEPRPNVCVVSLGRGATAPGGATGEMTVRNVGCRIVNYSQPDSQVATSRLELVKAPEHGVVEIVQPNVVTYTPRSGFTGADEFTYAGSGPGRSGEVLLFRVRVSVRVVGAGDPLR